MKFMVPMLEGPPTNSPTVYTRKQAVGVKIIQNPSNALTGRLPLSPRRHKVKTIRYLNVSKITYV